VNGVSGSGGRVRLVRRVRDVCAAARDVARRTEHSPRRDGGSSVVRTMRTTRRSMDAIVFNTMKDSTYISFRSRVTLASACRFRFSLAASTLAGDVRGRPPQKSPLDSIARETPRTSCPAPRRRSSAARARTRSCTSASGTNSWCAISTTPVETKRPDARRGRASGAWAPPSRRPRPRRC